MLHLVITHPLHEEQRVALEHDEYIVGRDPDAPIPLRDRKVSRKHARIYRRGDGYFIEDLGSVNGLVIGGTTVRDTRKLTPGLEIDIGGFIVKVVSEEAREALTFSLTGRSEPLRGQVFMLPVGELEVGRVDGNAIVIPDASVSRTHAVLTVDAHSVCVEDQESSNGTFVNDVRVGKRVLEPGDTLRFGNVELRFAVAGAATPSDIGRHLWQRLAGTDLAIKASLGLSLVSLVALLAIVILIVRTPAGASRHVSTAEADYERLIEQGLLRAREQASHGAWDDAIRTYQMVLASDPINATAREGASAAQQERLRDVTLGQARQALTSNLPGRALELAESIPVRTHYGKQAMDLAAAARAVLANDAYNEAAQLCRKRDWRACHEALVRHLSLKPDSASGRKLIAEAEGGLKAARMAFIAWEPPQDEAQLALKVKYPDDELRAAARLYAAGDLAGARQRAQAAASRPGGSRLVELLATAQREQEAAESAFSASDTSKALKHLEAALTADSALLPAELPSKPRQELEARLVDELNRLGEEAFGRGERKEAFRHWLRASDYRPEDSRAIAGLARLEAAASEMLLELSGDDTKTCTQLHEITTMTRPQTTVHLTARARMARCR